jgi:hypothetical protein
MPYTEVSLSDYSDAELLSEYERVSQSLTIEITSFARPTEIAYWRNRVFRYAEEIGKRGLRVFSPEE